MKKTSAPIDTVNQIISNSRSHYCEFFGLPACGKSTLARELNDKYGESFILSSKLSKITKYCYYKNIPVLIHSAYDLSRIFIRYRYFNPRRYLLILSLVNRYYYAVHKKKTVLCDHGIIQNMISLNRSHRMTLITLDLLRGDFLPTKDMLFLLINTDVHTCIDRELKRGTLGLRDKQALDYGYHLYRCKLDYVLNSGLIQYHEISIEE